MHSLKEKFGKVLLKSLGQLAQLVQSTSFTPRGSGVRIPHCPQPILYFIDIPFGAISSVGSEHLVYTEGVGGSNPSLPTIQTFTIFVKVFLCLQFYCTNFLFLKHILLFYRLIQLHKLFNSQIFKLNFIQLPD